MHSLKFEEESHAEMTVWLFLVRANFSYVLLLLTVLKSVMVFTTAHIQHSLVFKCEV